ncbi:DoxX family protein [Paraherbaspirillum soli]|uniref:DoxX family protein n=1 Tax=Paraherbaspirillum soli TaxID=631222 RepID=A0ABW0M5J7_9BURK
MIISPTLYRSGRALLASLFIVSGILKLTAFTATVGWMAGLGVPFAMLAVIATIAVEIGGGLAIASGWQVRPAAVLVALFTVAATLTAHRFWAADATSMQGQLTHFLKNIALIGALLMVAALEVSAGQPAKSNTI